jgi:hypothetical protein
MLYGDEAEAGQNPAEALSDAASELPTGVQHLSVQHPSVQTSSPPPVFHPLAYRGVVANWPIEWREQWGRRANSLEEGGLSWRDAETQAFVEVWNQLRHQQSGDSAAAQPATNGERN